MEQAKCIWFGKAGEAQPSLCKGKEEAPSYHLIPNTGNKSKVSESLACYTYHMPLLRALGHLSPTTAP